jgi:hypothetical protein
VTVIDAWPMNVESVFAFTPAAIISDANVSRHSCSPIRASCDASHARPARRATVAASNGLPRPLTKTSPSERPARSLCAIRLVAT